MEPLGVISGIILLQDKGVLGNLVEKEIATEFGNAFVFLADAIAFIPRHGKDPKHHILPHLINNKANLKALKDIGVKEVISINSTGSLKKKLKPGMMVVPDDFIMFSGTPTTLSAKAFHITPKLSDEIRRKWIEAAHECGIKATDGGVYWQTSGPRLETKAEISMMSRFADIVGMTMASEAIIAQELGLMYAALCSIDNYGHGLGEKELTIDEILQHARTNTDIIIKIVTRYIERRRG